MTVLETISIMEKAGNFDSIILISFILGVGFFIGLLDAFYNDEEVIGTVLCILGIIAMGACIYGVIGKITAPYVETGRNKYIVKVDDDYSLNEFYNKYKILEHSRYTDVYTMEEIINE